ncbi:transcription antitermination factor NusB [Evansella cellulosilytica]|uniref:Transcription antitermination protein NusB n=1 Tax=Evansella cellulosilytica (strain ATCC 21833 / DSM 2522 / FERM P-1141 / JCM 9156 / N-4) TaxID=649639 RepID=E6TXQ0_EVAC2|nr:transcription antitermination factor NusB [Evansella cellulosilytica]ADU29976.1 NusB antitermination factor [Evansella cellulosilytica DSM 2522]
MNRRVARVRAVQSLYQIEMTGVSPDQAIDTVLENGEISDSFLSQLVEGTVEHLHEIDELLISALKNWALSRISRVDRAILRMATYEMKCLDDIPMNVSINEAIDIAKGFTGEEESGKFVNGILSNIATKLSK